jgi:hydroxyethylthiazole kinase-like uncharacterized protein yjeF
LRHQSREWGIGLAQNRAMHRITPHRPHPLFDTAATRRIEAAAAAGLPPHALMQRAGLAVARLAMAIAPHARTIWVACGPGNNGGDGLEAAMHLKQWGRRVVATWLGDEAKAPADALASLRRARDAGVAFEASPPFEFGLAIDALLGIGAARAPGPEMAHWLHLMADSGAPVLCVDVPSGLDAGTGALPPEFGPPSSGSRFTLSLLTLKPGLFTASGRDAAGDVWFDDLGIGAHPEAPSALLAGPPPQATRPHASHKGSWGDVSVIGGAPGMAGAALLAASAALHAGAGRVFVGLLDGAALSVDPITPELMLRDAASLDLKAGAVVCGCGGGDAVRALLPRVLASAPLLVLDADALNAIAADTQLQVQLKRRSSRGWATVLTPHPLEAARLAGMTVAQVQADRLAAAGRLAKDWDCVVALKGSGTVTAAPQGVPCINPTGNARLGTAGTGDVLAGMIGARLAAGANAFDAACGAAYAHGAMSDSWPAGEPLTASRLAKGL